MADDTSMDQVLEPIIRAGYEDAAVDYKGPGSWRDWSKQAKVELVRDIAAMANGDVPGSGLRMTRPLLLIPALLPTRQRSISSPSHGSRSTGCWSRAGTT